MEIKSQDDRFWMQKAYEEALKAAQAGEVPIGAVLVSADGQLLASQGNQVIGSSDPSAHAEMLVIREGAKAVKNYRLENTVLYTTLEPCAMCACAMVHARIKRLVFAARDFKAGAAGSVFNLLRGQPLNHQVCIDEGMMQEECLFLLKDFFLNKRRS